METTHRHDCLPDTFDPKYQPVPSGSPDLPWGTPRYGLIGLTLHATKADAENEARWETYCERQAIDNAAQAKAQAEREAAEKAERESLNGFTDGMTPMQRGRAVKTMDITLRFRAMGGKIMTRREAVERLVSDGATLEESNGRKIIMLADGTFYDEKTFGKTGIAYADYLARRRDSKAA